MCWIRDLILLIHMQPSLVNQITVSQVNFSEQFQHPIRWESKVTRHCCWIERTYEINDVENLTFHNLHNHILTFSLFVQLIFAKIMTCHHYWIWPPIYIHFAKFCIFSQRLYDYDIFCINRPFMLLASHIHSTLMVYKRKLMVGVKFP